jgi:outer membrane protein assembly factor BamE (lipoprotein component of BamABCDE complex)
MSNALRRALAIAIVGIVASSCAGVADRRAAVNEPVGDQLSAGKVQREIRVGMTGADVAEVLGSPNVVSTDELGREVWIYDRISTDTAYSQGSAFGSILILGGSSSSGASSRSQRTLTVIIKFDEQKRVRDFAYRQSSF